MSIQRELIISYGSQVYAALLGILLIPIYLHYVGAESYGLIGFSLMLQGAVQLLDVGLAQTLMREASRFRVNTTMQSATYSLLCVGEKFFLLLSLMLIACVIVGLPWLSENWLKAEQLPNSTIRNGMLLATGLACLRLYTNFYRSGILGCGRLNWINTVGAALATVRYIGAVPLLACSDVGVIGLFVYQMLVGVLEVSAYRWYVQDIVKPTSIIKVRSMELLRQHCQMLGALAIVSWLWTVITQLDKVLLSHWLSLSDYGHFTLAISAAGVVLLLAVPVGQMLQPRMNMLAAEGDRVQLLEFYRSATQLLTALFATAACLLAFYAEPILFLWTGDIQSAEQAAPILFWYALGNASAALLVMPFMLQYAIGNLRMHLAGNLLFGLLWLPAIAWAAYTAGGSGTGIVWFAGNSVFLLGWTSFTHGRLFPELPTTWLIEDVLVIALTIVACVYLLSILIHNISIQSWLLLPTILLVGIFSGGIGLLQGRYSRSLLFRYICP